MGFQEQIELMSRVADQIRVGKPTVFDAVQRKKDKGHLGVGRDLSYQRNLEIVLKKMQEDEYTTVRQIQFLRRFAWTQHQRGLKFISGCNCLACKLLHDIGVE